MKYDIPLICGLLITFSRLSYGNITMVDPLIERMKVNTSVAVTEFPQLVKQLPSASWSARCWDFVPNLALVKLQYWGFDQQTHVGYLLVNKALAKEVIAIFKQLHAEKFPIESMRLIHEFQNSDEASMAANNTSAFNCRQKTSNPNAFSWHAYGRAIDINPRLNPYVDGKQVLPANGRSQIKRDDTPGKITRNSSIYRIFAKHGWSWGGNWITFQDYQHMEKRG